MILSSLLLLLGKTVVAVTKLKDLPLQDDQTCCDLFVFIVNFVVIILKHCIIVIHYFYITVSIIIFNIKLDYNNIIIEQW